jgi:hypothetical protein
LSYSTETAYGGGPTRDDAYLKALEDCNALMSMASSLAISSGQRREGGTCSAVLSPLLFEAIAFIVVHATDDED